MRIINRSLKVGVDPIVDHSNRNEASIQLLEDHGMVKIYSFSALKKEGYQPTTIKWKIPAINVKGVWTSNALLNKRIRADWEHPQVSSRISVDAPVISAFGHRDENVMTVAVGDATNTIHLEAAIQEEDNHIYCVIGIFEEDIVASESYSCKIRVDYSEILFSDALQESSKWLQETLSIEVMPVPLEASLPLYSTWYSYHQNFTEEELLRECEEAVELGYKVIIVDDGWQTKDSARGYDYTGDWNPDRMTDVHRFVSSIHGLGMKVMFWYSVPFCGRKSQAYQRFKGKFLTENHPWAPVFDPRFKEVRSYLVGRYTQALKDWKIDGLKLDFIDDFRIYSDTEIHELGGRDTLSVNEGVLKLIKEIKAALIKVNPEVLIEFRQKYIGPMLRHVGNMFRAFDCPYDSVMNRVRTTDVRLLCGGSAVHSDMLTWNSGESVELAALQFASIMFSVPQLSVVLEEQPEEHLAMICHFTNYWNTNREVLIEGYFLPMRPLSNYPILSSSKGDKCIYGVYEEICLKIDPKYVKVDIINGLMCERLVIDFEHQAEYEVSIVNCMGATISDKRQVFSKGIHVVNVPACGIVSLNRIY